MRVDLKKLGDLVDQRLVSVQKHPELDLYIYNYTQKAQFDHVWTPDIRMCRGLIVNGSGEVIARPFDKFFNMQEHDPEELPKNEKFVAYDKADGSLGIMYPTTSSVALATRGSFLSDQSQIGTDMLRKVLNTMPAGMFKPNELTYLFEIIYPENRIVIDYHGVSKLIFLGAREIETGRIFTPDYFPDIARFFPSVQPVEDFRRPRENAEGVVLYYESGFMCKVKYEEYVRLHRLVTGVNAKTLWELMRNKQPFDELLDRVPDEFMEWIKKTRESLQMAFAGEMIQAEEMAAKARELPTRKEQADFILNGQMIANTGIVFLLLDKKQDQAEQAAWKIVRPSAERPFKEDIDL